MVETSSYRGKTITIIAIILIIFTFVAFNIEFRTSILSGFIFATLSYPIHKAFQKLLKSYSNKLINKSTNKPYLSDNFLGSASAIIIVLVLGSFTAFIAQFLVREVSSEIYSLSSNTDFLNWVRSSGGSSELVQSSINFVQTRLSQVIQTVVSFDNFNKLLSFSQTIFSTVLGQLIYVIIFLISWFNALLYGSKWLHILFKVITLEVNEENQIKKSLKSAVRNIIYANLLAGLINSMAVLIIMSLFGIPGAFLMTILAFVIGFLPISPSEAAYVVPILVIASTNPLLAIVVAICSELFILWQNYAFLPGIVLSGNAGNPLFIITSVISGINYFGVMGFIIGPVIMILIINLAQILLQRSNN